MDHFDLTLRYINNNLQKRSYDRNAEYTHVLTTASSNNNNNNNNNNITTTDNNNLNTNTTIANVTTTTTTTTTPKPLQPAGYQPFIKKHRAPAPPPPQAGVAAATVSVIRQSSFLYGAAGIGHQHTQ
ncbi:hypothetical protein CVS40_1993 [Lucilia cuprina]|nr:hypothetical protein CVS40_1993 [Lucilia cuprina]